MEPEEQKLLFIFAFEPETVYASANSATNPILGECLLSAAHIYYGTPTNKAMQNCRPCLILKLISPKGEKKFSFILAKPIMEANFIGEVMCNSRDQLFKKEDGSTLKIAYDEDYQEIFHFCRRSLIQFNSSKPEEEKMRNNLYDLYPEGFEEN